MEYIKKVWTDGELIEANDLNNIENGIEKASEITSNISSDDTTVTFNKGITSNSPLKVLESDLSTSIIEFNNKENTESYGSVGKCVDSIDEVQLYASKGNLIIESSVGNTFISAPKGEFTRLGANAISKAQIGTSVYGLELSLSGPATGWGFSVYGDVAINLGKDTSRYGTLYTKTAVNTSSDKSLKENVTYIKSNNEAKSLNNEAVTTDEMYYFVKDDLKLANYNYIENSEKTLGFIAQDCFDKKVGKEFIREDVNGLLSYDTGAYANVLAGALQKALEKIENLEARLVELESK